MVHYGCREAQIDLRKCFSGELTPEEEIVAMRRFMEHAVIGNNTKITIHCMECWKEFLFMKKKRCGVEEVKSDDDIKHVL